MPAPADDIHPFTISIPDSTISTLKQKLSLATFPDELSGAEWDYGCPLADIKRIAAYWRDEYDWRKAEAKLNELPHFKTRIEYDDEKFGGLDVHFIHQPSESENAVPLLFVHGWPGSFLEVTKILPLLAESPKNGGPAFHVVAPSLPNFGFSDGVKETGFGQRQYAETCHKLMLKLGYTEYVTQGGDWGTTITRVMGYLYPKHVKASHINMVISPPPKPTSAPLQVLKALLRWFTAEEKAGFERTMWFHKQGSGYYNLQNTKPQTLGYALHDSPVGLLAWIYEKLHDWTDGYAWTDEEVCTWISVYAFSTAGPAASLRIYKESFEGDLPAFETARKYIPVKLGVSYFPKELVLLPKSWSHGLGPVVFQGEHEKGGHFAAWEEPEALVGDLVKMFGKGGGAFGVVKGKSGYAA
ncbi:alpha/beta-hydrolase [Westerdykella ornata]|uniref:Alpha/beta-hydrolase n=1 Tax=Westerdykella ornata TaxID=318751 RepID=A0A6A6J9T3_WESOR|nr:alpha/beta-hydrolase [Westerdykella ornata]KAF2272984.1 alpha/beta-hydrolase [Westerdykella ornata]